MVDRDRMGGWWQRLAGRLSPRGEEPGERLPTPSEIAEETTPRRSALKPGIEQAATIEPETFVEKEMRRRQESDQSSDANGDYERLKVRSLPIEQQERDKGRGR